MQLRHGGFQPPQGLDFVSMMVMGDDVKRKIDVNGNRNSKTEIVVVIVWLMCVGKSNIDRLSIS
jgi:hypothetical protein